MEEVGGDWYQEKKKKGSFHLLDEALEEQMEKYPPASRAKLYSYWSYIEGMWAEVLCRKNKEAEVKAVQAEAMLAMAHLTGEQIKETKEKLDTIWRNILTSQHHDVYWIETTDLKKKALTWLNEAIEDSEEIIKKAQSKIAKKLNTGEKEEKVIIVFNTLPEERKGIIRVKTEDDLKVVNDENKEVPLQRMEGKINFIDTLPAFGYRVYKLRKARNKSIVKKGNLEDLEFENPYYKARIGGDGLFKSIIEKGSQKELLNINAYRGGEIRLSLIHI